MKKLLLHSLCILFLTNCIAQKELWGLAYEGGTPDNYGTMFKCALNGDNPQYVHLFDSINGMKPYGRLFLASNGKLYGTATKGGFVLSPSETGGVLFEYDLILNTYRVVIEFGSGELPNSSLPESGVIEPVTGVLLGSLVNGGIYSYTIATETAIIRAAVPSFNSQLQLISNQMTGELMKASNGMIYGTTKYFSSFPNGSPYIGSIAKLNLTNNVFTIQYPLNSTGSDGVFPQGSLVEGTLGKLYGTTSLGGVINGNLINNDGVLFEYNINTNTYTKKIDFNITANGARPGALTIGDGNKLYGILTTGGQGFDPFDPNQHHGALYEYDLLSGAVTIKYNFGYDTQGNNFGVGARGALLKGSDNNLYGVSNSGIFIYNPITNNFTQTCTVCSLQNLFLQVGGDLTEICRKPSYHNFDIDTFSPCLNSPFTFDVQNTNATSYLWKKDGDVLPLQTTAILNLPNVTATDSGNYTCEMTNECGTTITMPLHLNVGCMGTDEMEAYKSKITLYPNPVKETLNIKLPENNTLKVSKYTIVTMLGQAVFESTDYFSPINVSKLPNGLYTILLKTDKGDWFGKFVKQ
ncbi:MAG TPA: choice-of-anchor tandem repeat GloVer-containing protein [Flavobacterium sp.]|jgi:hypothetical protein